jgi:hypothetical protein
MKAATAIPLGVEQPMQALLDLVEASRARSCAQILGDANARAAALRAQAQAGALARMRQAFEEQRLRRREQIAAAQARLATQRRLGEQQRTAALLRLAWEQLPGELGALWREPAMRTAWANAVLASARDRLPAGRWRIVHAPDWTGAEQQALVQGFAAATQDPLRFDADPKLAAGLKVICDGNVIDGTLEGLLADRADFESRLLRRMEPST